MSSFADFALLAAIPSYGGAEILRAQRILPSGAGPRVHLALFGRKNDVARRVVDVAAAAANVEHPSLARIFEVGRYDGIVYGVADPAEGVDVASLLFAEKQRKKTPPPELALGIAVAVARVVVALHESGDTWAAAPAGPGGASAGLTSIFPAGLSPDLLFLEPGGEVRLRSLAAAAVDPRAPSFFRAPDAAPTQASDVYSLGRLLMALLSADPTGQEAPRLPASSPVIRLLPRMLTAEAGDRFDLHDVVDRLEQALAPYGLTPAQAVREALAGPYRAMVVDAASGFVPAPRVIDETRARLPFVYSSVQRLFPHATAPVAAPATAALPPQASDDDVGVFTDARPAVRGNRAKTAATMLIDDLHKLALAAGTAPVGAVKKVTSPTMLIPSADVLKKMLPPAPQSGGVPEDDDDGFTSGPRADKTAMIDPSTFVPFAPPPPGTGTARPSSPPALAPASSPARAPPPSPSELSGPVRRPPTTSGPVFASSAATLEGSGPVRTTDNPTTPARRTPPPPPSLPSNLAPPTLPPELQGDSDIDMSEEAEPTMIAPTATPSLAPPPDTAKQAARSGTELANASTRLPSARTGRGAAPPPLLSADASDDGDDGHTAIGSNVPDLSNPSAPPRMGGKSDVFSSSGAHSGGSQGDPVDLDDGGAFQMVGDAGRTFGEDDNPFAQSTRMIPAQALQAARSQSDESSPFANSDDEPDGDGSTEMFTAQRMQQIMDSKPAPKTEVSDAPPTSIEPVTKLQQPKKPTAPVDASMTGKNEPAPAATRTDVGSSPVAGHVLIVEAPEGATVLINGQAVGTGRVVVDVDANARAVVKVTAPGFTPWSSVVQVQGRPRVRVRPALTAKKG